MFLFRSDHAAIQISHLGEKVAADAIAGRDDGEAKSSRASQGVSGYSKCRALTLRLPETNASRLRVEARRVTADLDADTLPGTVVLNRGDGHALSVSSVGPFRAIECDLPPGCTEVCWKPTVLASSALHK